MADLVAKREGRGLLQPPEPGGGANLCRHLASILLNMGGYGFFRVVLPFFPRASLFYNHVLIAICLAM